MKAISVFAKIVLSLHNKVLLCVKNATLLTVLMMSMPLTLNAKPTTESFQSELLAYQSTHILNGIFLITKSHQPVFSYQVGFANDTSQKFNHQMPFPIASLSKQFTACAILLLKEDNRLALHEPIINYLRSNHPIWQGAVPQWANTVTIHQLLTHSSGIPSYTNENIPDITEIPDKDIVPYIISFIKNKPLQFNPGENFEYNNTGFLLLSAIIDELSEEKSASRFLHNRIFKPLKMHDSFLPDIATERQFIKNINKTDQFPKRYIADLSNPQSQLKPVTEIHLEMPLQAAGAIISTIDDLLKWNEGLYSGKMLSSESLNLMTTIQISGVHPFFGPIHYGYGLYIDNSDPVNVIYYHGGWIQGVRAQLSFSPQSNASVVFFNNVSPDEDQDDEIQHAQVKALSDLGLRLQRMAISV